jgi:fluoroquinolone resistance protein
MQTIIEDEEFVGIDFTLKAFGPITYENCVFKKCHFLGVDLSQFHFEESEFEQCDLSLAKLNATALRGISFKQCKMMGLHFEDCNDFRFSLSFQSCTLDNSTFYNMKLKGTAFVECRLRECDFSSADLSNSMFFGSDLGNAVFDQTNLSGCDFRETSNLTIDPEKNTIKKAKFHINGVFGLLTKYDIEIEN